MYLSVMPAAPRFDAALNDRGHVVLCDCGECMPPGADGAEDDARDMREARAKALPKWAAAERPAFKHAWNRKLTA